MTPTATYRLQFHAGFTFADGAGLANYLRDLGVSHVYASPIAVARAGSTHGYDVVDPTAINPALGGEDGFRQMAAALKAAGLGIILDIVPNHLAVGGADNAWWLDVLEKGEASAFAGLFDIDWRPRDPALQGQVLAPFLGAPYGEALAGGDIRLEAGPDRSLWATAYGHHQFPIRAADRAEVFALGLEAYDSAKEPGRARLHDLLERQAYRLAWWQSAGDEINWRRFFDITELAGVRVEVPEVFDRIHALPLRLYAEGLIDGLRIDHIDGLADPAGYLTRLRSELAKLESARPAGSAPGPAYLVVEKILAEGEALSRDWACDGTTGYEFMDGVSALLHEPEGAAPLAALWREISGRDGDYGDEEHAARLEILTHGFAGQVDAVAGAFHDLARDDLKTRDLTQGALRRAITQLLTGFAAYRLYGEGEALSQGEADILAQAMARAQAAIAPADRPALDQIEAWLTGAGPCSGSISSARRWRPSRRRTPPSTAICGSSRATRWAPIPAAWPATRRTSTPPISPGRKPGPAACSPPPPTTTSGARTSAPGWPCSANARRPGRAGRGPGSPARRERSIPPTPIRCTRPWPAPCRLTWTWAIRRG